ILLKEKPVGDVLQVGKRLTLTADEPAGVVRLHVEQNSLLQFMFLDRGREAEGGENFFEGFWLKAANLICRHFFFFDTGVNTETAAGETGAWFIFVRFVCTMVSTLLTVQYNARPDE